MSTTYEKFTFVKGLSIASPHGTREGIKNNKKLGIRYISCTKDKKYIYLHFEISAKKLNHSVAIIYVNELDTIFDDRAIEKSKINIPRDGRKRITLHFDKDKNFTEYIFDDGNLFQATIICDGLSAKSQKFELKFKEIEKVKNNWKTISPIIHKSDFIGWNYPGVGKNCFSYAWKEMKNKGYDLVAPSWKNYNSSSIKINDGIYQIYLSNNLTKYNLKKGIQIEAFKKGFEYLKNSIESNIPVLVGVDDQKGYSNPDKTTDHFILIVGMGTDEKGSYFLFHDNAVNYKNADIGCSMENKLYCDMKNYMIVGKADKKNTYANKRGKYIVSQIRETKKK